MVDGAEFERWRAEAGGALEAARVQAGASLHNWACFAAEQAAQRAVKAFLHGVGAGPWGHDLVRLGAMLAGVLGDAWPQALDERLRRLSRHYIPARYPDAHPAWPASAHYGAEDARQAIGDAEEVLGTVDSRWAQLLEDARGA